MTKYDTLCNEITEFLEDYSFEKSTNLYNQVYNKIINEYIPPEPENLPENLYRFYIPECLDEVLKNMRIPLYCKMHSFTKLDYDAVYFCSTQSDTLKLALDFLKMQKVCKQFDKQVVPEMKKYDYWGKMVKIPSRWLNEEKLCFRWNWFARVYEWMYLTDIVLPEVPEIKDIYVGSYWSVEPILIGGMKGIKRG